MHFEGEFRVPGKAVDVLDRFADVPRMARCMPGAVLEPQAGDGSWPGAMVVSFGPKKIKAYMDRGHLGRFLHILAGWKPVFPGELHSSNGEQSCSDR